MTGAELRRIAQKAYGKRGWQKHLAAYLGRDVSTIRRYAEAPNLPPMVALAILALKEKSKKENKV